LNTELKTVIDMAKPLLGQKPVELLLNIDDHLPIISGDKRRIRQVLLNLLSNAISLPRKARSH